MLEFKAARYSNSALPLLVKTTSLPVTEKDGGYELPSPNNVLIKVHAAALNPLDVVVRNSLSPWFAKAERGIGYDYAGDVVAIGAAAAARLTLEIGDRVNGMYAEELILGNGSIAEYILLDVTKPTSTNCHKIPDSLSYQKAAAYPLVFGTAQRIFEGIPKENKRSKILILGAGTSVGRFCVQLAKKTFEFSEVVATCSGRSESIIRELGADKVIDYSKHKSMLIPVLEETKDGGLFDVIIDCCGNSDLFPQMSQILVCKQEGGSYFTIAGDAKMEFSKSYFATMLKNSICQIRALRSYVGLLSYNFHMVIFTGQGDFSEKCLEDIVKREFQIFIDSEFAFEEIDKAFQRVESNKAVGKVVVNIV